MADIIRPDFKGRVHFPEPSPLEEAAQILSEYADDVTRHSMDQHGAIDPLANEVCAYANICSRLARELRKISDDPAPEPDNDHAS